MTTKTVDEILEYAIAREQEAVEFYTGVAGRAPTPEMKATFLQFANEERGHRSKLEAVKSGRKLEAKAEQIADLKIADSREAVDAGGELDYPHALILAMKREKEAFRLYTHLAEMSHGEARDVFLALAQEEARHKLRFEIEYDDEVLTEN